MKNKNFRTLILALVRTMVFGSCSLENIQSSFLKLFGNYIINSRI